MPIRPQPQSQGAAESAPEPPDVVRPQPDGAREPGLPQALGAVIADLQSLLAEIQADPPAELSSDATITFGSSRVEVFPDGRILYVPSGGEDAERRGGVRVPHFIIAAPRGTPCSCCQGSGRQAMAPGWGQSSFVDSLPA